MKKYTIEDLATDPSNVAGLSILDETEEKIKIKEDIYEKKEFSAWEEIDGEGRVVIQFKEFHIKLSKEYFRKALDVLKSCNGYEGFDVWTCGNNKPIFISKEKIGILIAPRMTEEEYELTQVEKYPESAETTEGDSK